MDSFQMEVEASNNLEKVVGDGVKINFWQDRWLNVPIFSKSHELADSLDSKIVLPMDDCKDKLIWEAMLDEDVLYVFFQCSYAWKIWNWLAYTFKVAFPQLGSTMEYFKFIFSQNISSQFYNLQVAMFMYILGQIWFNRNRTCFDGKNDPTIRIIAACKAYLVRIAKFCPRYARFGSKKNTLVDLGVGIKYCRVLCVQIVSWIPPPRYWIKVNTDGMLKGSLHVFACGAMFKNFEGKVLGGFSCSVQVETVFVVELLSWLLSMLLFEVGLCLDRM
ncbi:hypothetical protein WN944_014938 [Citrus x changshan-huyou]|uniref:Uncharacterized protein n=1 Tax=Citrus x changshan-huyou TaxID=2935761 RepID=A0AAP0QM66_9ROSI